MPTLLIGDTAVEANNHILYANGTHACRFTAVASGDLTDFYLYIGDTAGTAKIDVGLYDNDAVNNRPGNLLYNATLALTPVAKSWLHWNSLIGWTLVVGTVYWLAWAGSAAGSNSQTRYKAGASIPSNQYMLANSRWPNPFGAPSASAAREVSVYGEAAAPPPAVGVAGGGGFFRDPFIVELEAEIIEKAAKTALVYFIKATIDWLTEYD